jgi:hypothetical protein
MSSLEQIGPWAVRHGNTLLFGLIWITITIAAVLCVAVAVGRVAAPTGQDARRHSSSLPLARRQAWALSSVAMSTLLVAFVASYIALIVAWDAFAYYDDSLFTLSTLKGHNIRLWILPESGRFMPLAFQEFNLARHFTDTIAGYHMLPIVQLLILCGILLVIDHELSIKARSAFVILALISPSILVSFINLLFSERSVLLFLACLVLSIKRFEQTQSAASAVSAMICAQLMVYSKETAFLLLLGLAVSRLVLRCGTPHIEFGRLWVRESRLDLGLASLAVLFLIFYFGVMGIHGNMGYAASARLPRVDVVVAYTRIDLLPWLLIAVLLGRVYMILRHRAPPVLLWDGLAAGGVACFLAYIYLGMFSVYYTAPVDLIAVLYVGRFAVLSWTKMPPWRKAAAISLTLIIIFQDALVSSFSVYERKNVIQGKVELASVVETQHRAHAGNSLRLFFPFSGGYVIMEFGAYLSSRGIPVKGAGEEVSGLDTVVLAEARRTRAKNAPNGPAGDGPCVEWTRVWCQVVNGPAPGDLVIVLPDDEASLADASAYRDDGVLLWFGKPRLPIPDWLRWLFDSLPVGPESRYRDDALPDRWMDGSVTRWE